MTWIGTGRPGTSYWDLPDFSDVYLEDSWITDVRATLGLVELTLDIVLRETHPDYRLPLEGEQYCYRNGCIRFEAVSELRWTDQGQPPASDRRGAVDFGCVDIFERRDDSYRLVGDFGSIEIRSPRLPQLNLL